MCHIENNKHNKKLMDMKEWKAHNELLQQAYRDYLSATKQKEKEVACAKIQRELEWPPFEELCFEHSAQIYGIGRYGLDYLSEQCIGLIDKIAKGELEYNY